MSVYEIGFTISSDYVVKVDADSIDDARETFLLQFTTGGEMDPAPNKKVIRRECVKETSANVQINRIDGREA